MRSRNSTQPLRIAPEQIVALTVWLGSASMRLSRIMIPTSGTQDMPSTTCLISPSDSRILGRDKILLSSLLTDIGGCLFRIMKLYTGQLHSSSHGNLFSMEYLQLRVRLTSRYRFSAYLVRNLVVAMDAVLRRPCVALDESVVVVEGGN